MPSDTFDEREYRNDWRRPAQDTVMQSPDHAQPIARKPQYVDSDKKRRSAYIPQHAYESARRILPENVENSPLIDRVTNRWRDEKKLLLPEVDEYEPGFCDLEDENSCPNTTYALIRTRRFRRTLMVILLALVGLHYIWRMHLRPRLRDEWSFQEGFLPDRINGTYGLARGGDFDGIKIADLDPALIPGGEADPDGIRRLVFVGDIHGCVDELDRLLKKIDFDEEHDHLIATGDVVSKGPHNVQVLDKLIRLKASSVRGNHEDRLLEQAKSMSSTALSEEFSSKGAAKDAALLKKLDKKHLKYLREMPLMLRIPALPKASGKKQTHVKHGIVVAHAGLVPHIPLRLQDPYYVMNMRSLNPRTHLPSADRDGPHGDCKPWFTTWNWYNSRLEQGRTFQDFFKMDNDDELDETESVGWLKATFGNASKRKHKPQVVIYGHDSKMGLQIEPWSKGLDSACVSGGDLTALVLNSKGKQVLHSVRCKDYRD
ncbi:Hypothetical protein R9X50_00150100 [Acrodontium crateriforme]|uniref:Calcineurin-like phosphoesterase domain-containing protein n=1 Tax=Acrodontium crateriforme TaxID=150365 RepID=A0AAQ3RA45_9PEZI|nr:Hypothetical protein R9X50_00150100 [Acrodontium crateriforme]